MGYRIAFVARLLQRALAAAGINGATALVDLLCAGGMPDERLREAVDAAGLTARVDTLIWLVWLHAAAAAELPKVVWNERHLAITGAFATFERRRAEQVATGMLVEYELEELVAMLERVPATFSPATICGLVRDEVSGFDEYHVWSQMQRFGETWLDLYELGADGSVVAVETAETADPAS